VILNIRVIPKASRNLVEGEGNSFRIYLTQPAHDGLANKQLIESLAEHLKVKRYRIKIIKGEKSRNKVIEINAAGSPVKK